MKPLKQKCEECGALLPEGLEKYANARILCGKCYFRLRKNGDSIEKKDVRREYLKWLVS